MRTQALIEFAEAVSCDHVIVQHRDGFDTVPVDHPKVEYLFDRSGGAGRAGFHEWPHPPRRGRVGYSGGIGPANIDQAMEFVNQRPSYAMWLDMEGRVRDDGWLCLPAVKAVLAGAFPK